MKKRLEFILTILMMLSAAFSVYAAEDASIRSLASTMEEPDESGIPRDDLVSMAEDGYGYSGLFDYESADFQSVRVSEGIQSITDQQILHWGGGAIISSGDALLGIRNSDIRGETAVPTAPLADEYADLLVSGNIRTVLALDSSQTFLMDSTIISRNLGAITLLSGAAAVQPSEDPTQTVKEIGFYTYDCDIQTMDGGYGAYAGFLSNLYLFASVIRGAEIGVLSDTFGNVIIGDNTDGENFKNLSVLLSESDQKDPEKPLDSIVEGGRNALVITGHNKPEYWPYEGYSQAEIPWRHATITAHHSTFRTKRNLDRDVLYGAQEQAYIHHTAGSTILLKSTNAQITLDSCELVTDPSGTGHLVQSVATNDTASGTFTPDGEDYPGILVDLQHMTATGDIAHEDYQRSFLLMLSDTTINGAMNEYDCNHWKEAASQEGFLDYIPDQEYQAHHGLRVSLTQGSVWNVTAESHLSRLFTEADCQVNGIIFLDGARQEQTSGMTYEGNVVVMPLSYEEVSLPSSDKKETAPTTQPTTQPSAQPQTEPATKPQTEPATQPQTQAPTQHVHDWVSYGGSPAGCTTDGVHVWICQKCGTEKTEPIPAYGHDWQLTTQTAATCTAQGVTEYTCSRCGEVHKETYAATGHHWDVSSSTPATCTEWGEIAYTCQNCGELTYDYLPPLGHTWTYEYSVPATCLISGYDAYHCYECGADEWFNFVEATGHNYIIYPTPGQESLTHSYECTKCGDYWTEPHAPGGGSCPVCGYTGAYG